MKFISLLGLMLSLTACNLHKKQICTDANAKNMDSYAKRYDRTIALLGQEVADGTMELLKTKTARTYQLKMIDTENEETTFENMRFCKVGNQLIAETIEVADVDGKDVEANMLFPVQATENELTLYLAYGEAASLDEHNIPYEVIGSSGDLGIEVIFVDNTNVSATDLVTAYDLYGFFKGTL